MPINLRKETQTPFEEYKQYLTKHMSELNKLAKLHKESASFKTDEETMRFSLLIKVRVEILIDRTISYSELSSFISLMDNIAFKQLCTASGHQKHSNNARISQFIKTWEIDTVPDYNNEFLYYTLKLDKLVEEETKLINENNKLKKELANSKWL